MYAAHSSTHTTRLTGLLQLGAMPARTDTHAGLCARHCQRVQFYIIYVAILDKICIVFLYVIITLHYIDTLRLKNYCWGLNSTFYLDLTGYKQFCNDVLSTFVHQPGLLLSKTQHHHSIYLLFHNHMLISHVAPRYNRVLRITILRQLIIVRLCNLCITILIKLND